MKYDIFSPKSQAILARSFLKKIGERKIEKLLYPRGIDNN
jgi:hypothetical protein